MRSSHKPKFKLPKRVKVLTETYRVKVVKGLAETHEAAGMTDPILYLILIDSELLEHPKALKRTYYHEVGHAFAFESGLHETCSQQALEMFCQNFGAWMCQV